MWGYLTFQIPRLFCSSVLVQAMKSEQKNLPTQLPLFSSFCSIGMPQFNLFQVSFNPVFLQTLERDETKSLHLSLFLKSRFLIGLAHADPFQFKLSHDSMIFKEKKIIPYNCCM